VTGCGAADGEAAGEALVEAAGEGVDAGDGEWPAVIVGVFPPPQAETNKRDRSTAAVLMGAGT
jgi:hypothetical protein